MRPVCALASALVLSLALGACSSLSAGPPPVDEEPVDEPVEPVEEPLESTLVWEPCGEPFECSSLDVPFDHAVPDGRMVSLSLIRLPAPAAARRIGSLVLNPGGPGGSGVDFVRHGAIDTIPAELRARFDVVGFDPRGVGASAGIHCGQEPVERFAASLAGGVGDVLAAAQGFAAACAGQGGDLLPHVATDRVVADLDVLREALGDRRLTYVGYSYGTLIGALYAERFPDKVRALVLDGAVDPSQDVVARARDKAAATQAALTEFLGWCGQQPDCPLQGLGDAPTVVFDAAVASLSAGAVPAPLLGPGRALSKGAALYTISVLLTDRTHGWPALAEGLAWLVADGDASLLLSVFDTLSGRDADAEEAMAFDLAQLMAVNCLDLPAPPPEAYPQLVADLEATSPLFGALSLLTWAPCSYWPAPAVRSAAPVVAADSPPLVVIGTVHDGVTPYGWSEALAEQLAHAVLFTRDGEGHTAFGGGNVCTDRAIMGYLLDEQPPQVGMSCG